MTNFNSSVSNFASTVVFGFSLIGNAICDAGEFLWNAATAPFKAAANAVSSCALVVASTCLRIAMLETMINSRDKGHFRH